MGSVGVIERSESRDALTAGGHLEHRAVPRGPARIRGAEEIAAAVLDQPTEGIGPVGVIERSECRDAMTAGGQLENRAVPRGAASVCGAEEIASAVLDES